MFAINTFIALLALVTPLRVRADVMPLEPAPGDVDQGPTCTTTWGADPNSTTIWKNMAIELMTGSNEDMIHLTTVATGQDGTVNGAFSYPCPSVTPNSAIYFYQFSNPQKTTQTWTGRFAIASSTGQTTPPANPNTPGTTDGAAWGVGSLTNPALAVAPPTFVSGSNSTSSTSSTNSSVPVVISSTAASSSIVTTVPTGIITAVVNSSASLPTSANSASPASQSGTTSGALGVMTTFNIRVWGAAVAATLALSFAW